MRLVPRRIQRADALGTYWREVSFALPTGDGAALRPARAALALADLTPAQQLELADLDVSVIDALRTTDIQAYLLDDDAERPLADWWWHLGALRARRYPAELLPEPLRAVYLAGL